MKFCEECGTKLVLVCSSCGREVRPTAKFCGECGMPLTEKQEAERRKGKKAKRIKQPSSLRAPDARRQTLDSSQPEAERRQLTVMFCDLVGSTALSAQLDPEELREIVCVYQETCAEVLHRYEGHIAQYLGDGLLVYFGYPAAHEDDAQRAVRAGLEIIAALQIRVPSPLAGEGQGEGASGRARTVTFPYPNLPPRGGKELQRLQVRIGIHTGLVVVGEIGGGDKREQLALGETPNIAARLQGIAEPDALVVSGTTYRLIQGLFNCQDLGVPALKGLPTPLQVYRVIGESAAQSRFEVALSTGLTPLVGRDLEVGLLWERWAQAKEGEGQVVLLSGEPGIGKSRLVQILKEQVTVEGAARLEFRCSPYHQNSAFYPIIDHLQRLLQFHREESPQTKLEKLQQALARSRFPQADTLPLLAALLSLPQPEGAPPLTLSPQRQKQKTQEALVAWWVEEAEAQAVYCAWEDLHWADPSTLELLTLFLDQVPTTRLLAVLTFRPDFTPPWHPRSHITQLTLNRLGRQPVEAMVGKIAGGNPLPREVVQQIVARTDGVPLFVEELTKMIIESIESVASRGSGGSPDHRSLQTIAIPATLHDSLMARLDRLGPAKEVAQLGASLGREFSYELLHAVSPLEETPLQQALAKLVEAEVLYQRGLPPQARYLFKHALIQDAAYQSLLKSTRQQYHRQIAQVLEGRFPETKETQPELLAHHYTEAGLVEQAIPHWQQAGQRAVERSAHVEAISHLTKGLELLKTLPDSPEHIQRELTLQVTLGVSLMAAKGWAAPEVERAYSRARELCQQAGETPQLFPVLWGLWAFYVVRGKLQAARELAEQCLHLAQRVQDSTLLVGAHYALGALLVWLGEFSPARVHLEQGIAFYDLQQHRSHASLYGWDLGVGCLWYVAWPLWFLGYPDQALQRIHEALTLAQELAHPDSLDWTLVGAATVHQFRREGRLTQERAEAALALASEQGFALQLTRGTVLRGWALAEQGQGKEGIMQLQQSLLVWQTLSAELSRSVDLTLLAKAYGKVGQTEEGLATVAEALAHVHSSGERIYEAELYRLKGELTLQQFNVQGSKSKVEEAEECFQRAIEIACKQQAKSLELRAVMNLSRLWQNQGKTKEAHEMLAEIYSWFTEGFDTKDLQEAKALLTELEDD